MKMKMARREECREAIKYYACKCARILRFVKNEPNRVRLMLLGTNATRQRIWQMRAFKEALKNNMQSCEIIVRSLRSKTHGAQTVVGFGRTFIKGQLLIAVGIDANNGMFSTAFAIVETERLGQAIEALKPDAEHRHCVRHLHNNFKVAGHGSLALKQRLWATARTILEARDKPRITIVERIRIYLMLRVARQKKKIGSMWHPMLPYHGCNIKATEEPNKSGRPKKARTRLVDEIPKGVTRLRSYGIVIHCSDRQQYGKRQRQRQRKKERKRKKNEKRNQLSPSISRGTSIYKNNKTYTIRGGLTRTVATASQTAPIKVASQSTPTNVASQPAPCNFASQAGPSNFVS
ncbi:unnamed protein product [Prunus armeniaca]